jgi:hypothetical protein
MKVAGDPFAFLLQGVLFGQTIAFLLKTQRPQLGLPPTHASN